MLAGTKLYKKIVKAQNINFSLQNLQLNKRSSKLKKVNTSCFEMYLKESIRKG